MPNRYALVDFDASGEVETVYGEFTVNDVSGNPLLDAVEGNAIEMGDQLGTETQPVPNTSHFEALGTEDAQFENTPFTTVTAYGADPTGSEDSSSAFNDAMSNANAVVVPQGTYLIASDINVAESTTLQGLDRTGTKLLLDNSSSINMGSERSTVSGLNIDRAAGDENTSSGIVLDMSQRWTVSNCIIQQHANGIFDSGDSWVGTAKHLILQNNDTGTHSGNNHNAVDYIDVNCRSNGTGFDFNGSGHNINLFGCRGESNTDYGARIGTDIQQINFFGGYFESNDTGIYVTFDSDAAPEIVTVHSASFWDNREGIYAGTAANESLFVINNCRIMNSTDEHIRTSGNSLNDDVYAAYAENCFFDNSAPLTTNPQRLWTWDHRNAAGPSTDRPSDELTGPGYMFYDTTEDRPIFRNAADNGWVDSDGNSV